MLLLAYFSKALELLLATMSKQYKHNYIKIIMIFFPNYFNITGALLSLSFNKKKLQLKWV